VLQHLGQQDVHLGEPPIANRDERGVVVGLEHLRHDVLRVEIHHERHAGGVPVDETLFDTALARYGQVVVERNFGPLEAPGAGTVEIRTLLEYFASASDGPVSGRGCLLCNTAVELGPGDPSGSGFVQHYFERVSKAFYAALDNAQGNGELRSSVDPHEEADFFTASVLGLFVMLRATAPPTVIKGATRAAIRHLETLRSDTPTQEEARPPRDRNGWPSPAHIGTCGLPEMAKRAAVLGVKPCQAGTPRACLAVSTAAVARGPAILEEVLSTWLREGAAVTLAGDRSH